MIHSEMLEMSLAPAPFVYGGSFSDYVKERHKFRRFSTLTSLARAMHDECEDSGDDSPVREDEIKNSYVEARGEDIGTVSRIDIPEGSVSIVNLVDVARYISAQLYGETTPEAEDMLANENEEYGDDEEVDEGEGDDVSDVGPEAEVKSCAMPKQSEANYAQEMLEIPKPVVYEGTFQEYKKAATKFTRFRTLASFNQRCSSEALQEAPPLEPLETAPLTGTIIMEGVSPAGSIPCQLLAMAMPPSVQHGDSMYTTLSNAMVERMIASTMSGAKAAVKMAVSRCEREAPLARHSLAIEAKPCEMISIASTESSQNDEVIKSIPGKSPYRFRFEVDDLQDFKSFGIKASVQKGGSGSQFKDDGSNWIVEHSVAGSNYRHRQPFHNSGSGWGGGGGMLLEPICEGKFACDKHVKVTLPNGPASAESSWDIGKTHVDTGRLRRSLFS